MISSIKNIRPKQVLRELAISAIIILFLIMLTNIWVIRGGHSAIESSLDDAPSAQVAIILGARVFNGDRLSHVLADRLDTGIELYQKGKVEKLLLTGDHGRHSYDEVNTMRKYALAGGVPAEDIFMDHAGFNTYDSMYRARDVFKVEDALIITQKFHLARSVYTANTLGLRAVGIPADRHIYMKALQFEAREILARTKAFVQLHITRPNPKFLGPEIPITGDGRRTNDGGGAKS